LLTNRKKHDHNTLLLAYIPKHTHTHTHTHTHVTAYKRALNMHDIKTSWNSSI